MYTMKLNKTDYEVIGKREVSKDLLQMIREKSLTLTINNSDSRNIRILTDLKELLISTEELLSELNGK